MKMDSYNKVVAIVVVAAAPATIAAVVARHFIVCTFTKYQDCYYKKGKQEILSLPPSSLFLSPLAFFAFGSVNFITLLLLSDLFPCL